MPKPQSSVIPKTVLSPNLDLLRVWAVACVFVSHVLILRGVENDLGRFGVVLFFVHTSLVLMEALQRMDTAATGRRRLLQAFWVRRAFRIYPLAILFVLIAAAFHLPPFPGWAQLNLGFKGIVANLLLVQNLAGADSILAPMWSLPVEVEMYLVLPFAYLLLRSRVRHRALGLWLLAVVLAMTVPRLSWRLLCFVYGPCFTSGIVAFDLLRSVPRRMKRLPAWTWLAAIVSLTVLFNPLQSASLESKLPFAWVFSLFIGVLYPFCEEWSWRPLARAAHWVADRSYGIYLSHTVLFWVMLYPLARLPLALRIGLLAVATFAVPALLYRFVEQPLILVGAHLSRRILRRPEPHVEVTLVQPA